MMKAFLVASTLMASAIAFAPSRQHTTTTTLMSYVGRESAEARRANRARTAGTSVAGGQFTFQPESNIGGGLSAMQNNKMHGPGPRGRFNYGPDPAIGARESDLRSTRGGISKGAYAMKPPEAMNPMIGGPPTMVPENMSHRRNRFTYEPESNIGGGLAAISNRAGQDPAVPRVNANAGGKQAPTGSFQERIARGHVMLQKYADERLSLLLQPHLAAFAEDAIDQAELAWHKTEARKEAENELSARRNALDECEMLLEMGMEADMDVKMLSQQLQEATAARNNLMGKLESTLHEFSV